MRRQGATGGLYGSRAASQSQMINWARQSVLEAFGATDVELLD